MATISEVVAYLMTPKPLGNVSMGQVTAPPDPGNGLFALTGSFTNAQVLAMNSAPPDMIPAISGKIIVPRFVMWRVNYVAAYSANQNVSLRFAGVANDLSTPLSLIFNALPHVDQILMSDMIQSVNPFASGQDLRGLAVRAVSGADVTLGDPANVISFFAEYRVLDRP